MTTSFNRFQTTGSMAITLFVHFLGLQHDMHTNDDSSKYLSTYIQKSPYIKQVSPVFCDDTKNTQKCSPHTNHSTLEKRSPRTHITLPMSQKCFIIHNIADLPGIRKLTHTYASMACTGTTQTVPFRVPESYNL